VPCGNHTRSGQADRRGERVERGRALPGRQAGTASGSGRRRRGGANGSGGGAGAAGSRVDRRRAGGGNFGVSQCRWVAQRQFHRPVQPRISRWLALPLVPHTHASPFQSPKTSSSVAQRKPPATATRKLCNPERPPGSCRWNLQSSSPLPRATFTSCRLPGETSKRPRVAVTHVQKRPSPGPSDAPIIKASPWRADRSARPPANPAMMPTWKPGDVQPRTRRSGSVGPRCAWLRALQAIGGNAVEARAPTSTIAPPPTTRATTPVPRSKRQRRQQRRTPFASGQPPGQPTTEACGHRSSRCLAIRPHRNQGLRSETRPTTRPSPRAVHPDGRRG